MRTVGDFRKLNQALARTPCHIEPIHDLVMSVGRFLWGSAFDMSVGHCIMKLCALTRLFCRLTTMFSIYECQALAMGVSPSAKSFNEGLNFV